MRIATGRVIDGKVVFEGDDALVDGTRVTILALEDEEQFEVEPEAEARLRSALAEAERDEGIEGDAFLEQVEPA